MAGRIAGPASLALGAQDSSLSPATFMLGTNQLLCMFPEVSKKGSSLILLKSGSLFRAAQPQVPSSHSSTSPADLSTIPLRLNCTKDLRALPSRQPGCCRRLLPPHGATMGRSTSPSTFSSSCLVTWSGGAGRAPPKRFIIPAPLLPPRQLPGEA